MKFEFNIWYYDLITKEYIYVSDIHSKTDPEGYWGIRLIYDRECLREFAWSDDNSDPTTWLDERNVIKEQTPNLELRHKIEMIKNFFNI